MTFQVPTSASVVGGVAVSSFASTLMDDASASACRTTLGLGTFAVENLSACPAVTLAGNLTLGGNTIATTNATSARSIMTAQFTGDSTNNPFRWMTESVANPSANPRNNPTACWGYNVHPSSVATDTNDNAAGFWVEGCYGAAGSEQSEMYWQTRSTNGTVRRPFASVTNRTTGATTAHMLGDTCYIQRADDSIALEMDGTILKFLRDAASAEVARVANTTAGGGGVISYYNDGGERGYIGAFGSTYATAILQNRVGVYSNRGVAIIADHATGDITFHSGGTTTRLTITTAGHLSITDGQNIIVSGTTGTKIGTATDQKLGFYNATPIVRPGAYTQTYSTADKTHANPTAATLTVADGAGTNDNTIGAITADASVIAAVQEIADEINKLVADVADVKQIVNSVIDDLQSLGLVG